MARMTLAELQARNIVGQQVYSPLFQSKGMDVGAWSSAPGGNYESGAPIYDYAPTAGAAGQFDGYSFDWQNTGYGNTGTLTAFDPAGAQYGQYNQTDTPLGQSIMEAAALAAAGFGGAGLAGLGPLGGLFGGAGASGAVGGITPAGELAAYGATLTPAQAAAGAAGINLGGAAGIAGTAGAAGAAAAAAGGSAAQAGFWGSALKIAAPVLGSVAGGLIQSNAAGKAANAQAGAAQAGIDAIQKALAPYQQAGAAGVAGQQDLLGLSGQAKQQAAIDAIRNSPQFTSMQQLGENRILANASATGGLRGGNVQGALAQFSPALLSQLIDQQYSRLGGLTNTGANAAAGVGTSTANLQGQIGSAQAGQALANGSALQGAFSSGFGALGQYLGGQQQAPQVAIPQISTQTPFGQFQLPSGGF